MLQRVKGPKKGFTLIEIIVTMGLLGIFAIGSASVFTHIAKMEARIDAKQKIQSFAAEVHTVFASKTLCDSVLTTGQVFNASAAAIIDPAQGGLPFSFRIPSGETLERPSSFGKAWSLCGVHHFESSACVTSDCTSNPIYRVTLNGIFRSLKPSIENVSFAPRTLANFFVSLNSSGHIEECVNDPASDATNLLAEACSGLGGTINPTTNQCDFPPPPTPPPATSGSSCRVCVRNGCNGATTCSSYSSGGSVASTNHNCGTIVNVSIQCQ